MDTISEARLAKVCPALAAKMRLVDTAFQSETKRIHGQPDHLEIVQGWRSWDEQLACWAKGRQQQPDGKWIITDIHAIVTNAPPGHSWHEFGLATDELPRSLIGVPGWDAESSLWPLLRRIEESYGLVSGACFHRKDLPHTQLTGRFPVSPTDEVRAIYAAQGLEAVWKAASL